MISCCSYFNNPVEPTHTYGFYYHRADYEILVMPSKVGVQSAVGFSTVQKDTPVVALYLKTNTDFSKKYPVLDEQNSTYLYRVFLDSIGSAKVYYSIVLLSIKDGTTDTTYYSHTEGYKSIEIALNNEIMDHPEQFLWQVRIKQKETSILPPEPYAYVAHDVIITY